MKKKKTGETSYSAKIPGNKTNWEYPAQFDFTDGYVGITQDDARVILTPRQFDELVKFVKRNADIDASG